MIKEVFVPILGYEGFYEISNLGRIKSFARVVPNPHGGTMIRKEKFLKTNTYHPSGYRFVTLIIHKKRKNHSVHRLVATAFIKNHTNLPQINHIDTVKNNNIASNLEWCTNSENQAHANRHGLINHPNGERHGMSKVTEEVVLKIRALHNMNKYSQREIGNMFGITKNHVGFIVRRVTWRHI
jgi:NUMOD4 motif-containing protein